MSLGMDEMLRTFEKSVLDVWVPRLTPLGFNEPTWERQTDQVDVGTDNLKLTLILSSMPTDDMIWAVISRQGLAGLRQGRGDLIAVVWLCLLDDPSFRFNVSPRADHLHGWTAQKTQKIINRYSDIISSNWSRWARTYLQDWELTLKRCKSAPDVVGTKWWIEDSELPGVS